MTRQRLFLQAFVVGLVLAASPDSSHATSPSDPNANLPGRTATVEQWVSSAVSDAAGITTSVAAAFSLPQPPFGGGLANGLDGFDFTPTNSLTVSALGWYDHGGDGLLHSHPVAIYLTSTRTLVAPIANVTSADPLNETTNYRFTAVTPFALSAGTTYTIVGYGEGPSFDPYVQNPSGGWTFSPEIGYQRLRTALASGIEFPTTAGELGATQLLFSGPNFLFTTAPATIAGTVRGGIWQRPGESAATERTIPRVLVQAWRGETELTTPGYAGLDGTYSITAALLPTDNIRVTAGSEWLEVRDFSGNPDPPPNMTAPASQGPLIDFTWTSTNGYSGDALNAYYIAEDYGRRFWGEHMGRPPTSYKIRVNSDDPEVAANGGGTTGQASGIPVSSFSFGKPQFKDVVCHEFVHGMFRQDFGYSLAEDAEGEVHNGCEAKGLEEGLADYFTYAFTLNGDFGAGTEGAHRPLDQGDQPIKLPWCVIYVDPRGGYRAGQAVSGSLFDLRMALQVPNVGPPLPGWPSHQEFDRWIYDAVDALHSLPLEDRTTRRLRENLASAPVAGLSRSAEVAAAFDRHNIKPVPENTIPILCTPPPVILTATRAVSGDVQVIALSWSSVPGAISYRVYREYGNAGWGGVGPGPPLADGLTSTSFQYTDPDITAQVILTVVPVDSTGYEGNPSAPINTALVNVDEGPCLMRALQLATWPNPFRAELSISGALADGGHFTLAVHDLNGRRVKVLRSATADPGGPISARWDGRDENARTVPAGIYFIRLKSDRSVLLKKVALLP